MKHVCAVALIIVVAATTLAAQAPPTLAETAIWLQREAPTMAANLTEVSLDTGTCVLTFRQNLPRILKGPWRYRLSLRDVDVRSIVVSTGVSGIELVRISALAGAGDPFLYTDEQSPKKPKTESTRQASLYVHTDAGPRIADAISHATILCGAPVSVF